MRTLLALALAVALAVACSADNAPSAGTVAARTAAAEGTSLAKERPNVLFVLTDDMRADDLRFVPEVRERIAERGVTFKKSFVTTPVCCPSRATLLTGKYLHNHGTQQEDTFRAQASDALPNHLQSAGYRTGLIGKYLNGYDPEDASYVPPGWDSWYGYLGRYNKAETSDPDAPDEFSVNGERRAINQHDTDYMSSKAQQFVTRQDGRPWFLLVATNGPHGPAHAAPRHSTLYPDLEVSRQGAYNEADVSDKPEHIRNLPAFSETEMARVDKVAQRRARALASIDELVRDVTTKLAETGQLRKTYIVFTSDNGFALGEHRIGTGKLKPYEEHIRVPLVMRGPGIPRGESRPQLVANNDWGPTVLDWAGVAPNASSDGTSLAPAISDPSAPWRKRLLIEFDGNLRYSGVRTADGRKFIRYASGESELYDLPVDPHEMQSRHLSRSGDTEELSAHLDTLRQCSGAACREAEGFPAP